MTAWIAVACGGALGAMARFGISTYWLPVTPGRFPWSTLWINLAGSFLIGVLYTIIVERELWSNQWRIILMTGFLGALTTFSTFSVESVNLLQRNQFGLAATYASVSVLGCIAAAYVGMWLSDRII